MTTTHLVTDSYQSIRAWSHTIAELYMTLDQNDAITPQEKNALYQMYDDFRRIVDNLKKVEKEMDSYGEL